MKKLFLIPLMMCFMCVTAWADITTADGLRDFLTGSDTEGVVSADIDMDGQDAITVSGTKTLTLNANLTNCDTWGLFVVPASTSLTLLGTGSISGTGQYLFDVYGTMVVGVENGDGPTISAGYPIYMNKATTSLTLNSGSLVATTVKARCVFAKGTVTMNGGTISNTTAESIGLQVSSGSTATINGGSISAAIGIEVFESGTLAINGGSIIASGSENVYGVNNKGAVTMTNGTISATATSIDKAYGIALMKDGASVNVQGGTIVADAFGITGLGNCSNTPITISGGNITGTYYAGIYNPQKNSTTTITGGTITGKNSAIEMRAGNLDIDGGTFTATATEYNNAANGNGATTTGAAIAVAQHTTTQAIDINISGGVFNAIYPIAEANPQDNAENYVDLVSIDVAGGKFYANNTANVANYSENNKLSLSGGYYNLYPGAFVAEGYIAKNNTNNETLAEGYLFVVEQKAADNKTYLQEGAWQATSTWSGSAVPTEESDVVIGANGNVTVNNSAVAYAYTLDMKSNSTLTVENGATLVLGKNAVVDASANLVVEAGGQLLIAPSATTVQPKGTVTLVADQAGLKSAGLDESVATNYYWQHFAIPTTAAPTITTTVGSETVSGISMYNTWDVENAWQPVDDLSQLCHPFTGYALTNTKVFGTNVNYNFTGTLVGNASNPLVFTEEGFTFFGNSYLAPINIQALQNAMFERGMEYNIYLFTKVGGRQMYRAINEVTAELYGVEEIKPLQGFFMYAQKASQADFQYNSAVYSAFINKQQASAAPVRKAAAQYAANAVISVESLNGEADELVLVEADNFSNEYDMKADARKMMGNGMNLYADGSFDKLAVLATDNLLDQTMSFQAGNDVQYTMSFSNVQGNLILRDNVANQTIQIEEGETYTFVAQPNALAEARFQIVDAAQLPSEVEEVENHVAAKGIYTVLGQYLGEDFNALPAGVYVVDGVKIVK